MAIRDLPALNASLNATTAVLLVIGLLLIRSGRRAEHRATMLCAVLTSVAFLVSYLVYHFTVGSVRYRGTGWLRALYLSILLTHTIAALAIVPLAAVTLSLALRGRYATHRRWARVTFPTWIYVSITGVVIYLMLYRLG